MVKISIIIPVYCVEKYLPACLDSILNQTISDWELILVDDGSPDNSGVICDEYAQKDARIKVIHKKNEGVSVARNTGIEATTGKWIVFVDSDDFLQPSHLEDFKLDQYPDIELAVQGLEYYDQRTETFFSPKRLSNVLITDENLKEEVAKNNLLKSGYPVAKAYNAKFLNESGVRFDKRISYHEDHIFVLEYMNLCHCILLSDSISYKYRYFHTANSLSYKSHPWQNMNLSGSELIKRLDAMKDRFYDEGSDTCQRAYAFAYQCKIIAAQEMRMSVVKYSERKLCFEQLINKKQLHKYYSPKSTKGRFTKLLLSILPYILIDIYLWLVNYHKK